MQTLKLFELGGKRKQTLITKMNDSRCSNCLVKCTIVKIDGVNVYIMIKTLCASDVAGYRIKVARERTRGVIVDFKMKYCLVWHNVLSQDEIHRLVRCKQDKVGP